MHVASSARDVRGALEAGIPVVRLRRPGHRLDPEGPQPPYEVEDLGELLELLRSNTLPASATPDPTTESE